MRRTEKQRQAYKNKVLRAIGKRGKSMAEIAERLGQDVNHALHTAVNELRDEGLIITKGKCSGMRYYPSP